MRRNYIRQPSACLLAAALLAASGAGGAEPERPANVLLITIDTLRPDALGWVAGANATPAIDALAGEGLRFPAAVSPAPVTQPAHASLFTALVPRRHGVRDNGQVLGPGPATLAERLRQAGYATAAFVSGYPLVAGFGLERGFEHYDDELTAGAEGRLERPAARTTAAALAWLESAPRPWFLWLHYWDPHDPYTPPPGFERKAERPAGGGQTEQTRRAYYGEVAYVDRAIATLRAGLAGKRNTLTVFAADHGESLGEHGEQTHGFFIYDSTVAVPLIFHFPGRIPARQSAAAARLIDVAPTILELLGQPTLAPGVDGVSLTGMLSGGEQEMPPAVVESRRPWLSYGWSPLKAVRQGGWKLIAAPRPELYDLASDPGEATNLIDSERGKARELAALLRRAEEAPAASSGELADPEAIARLRALGYTGAGATAGEPPPGVADPKDRLDSWNALSQALELLEQGRHGDAVARFDAVLEKDPDNPFALSRSGAALIEAGDFTAAAERLRRAARLRPGDADTRSSLAVALSRGGYDREATEHWLELVRLQPLRTGAWVNLATSLGRSGKTAEAVRALEHAVELAPERADLRIRLAFVQHSTGNVEAAARHLRLAAERTGPEAFPHPGALGLLLLRTGKAEEAGPWLERSRPADGDFAEARFQLARLAAAAGNRTAARRHLELALGAAPKLRALAETDPTLADLLP